MPRTATTGGAITAMWRALQDEGDAVTTDGEYKLVEPEPNEYVTPPKGARARLRITGLSEQFQMPSYDDPAVMEDKIKLEFQIVTIKGNNLEWMTGKRFTQMVTNKISQRSTLGLLFAELTGQQIPRNSTDYPMDDFIGTEFVSLIGTNESGTYAKINPEAIESGKTVLSPAVAAYVNDGRAAAPQPALVGAHDDGNELFADEEDI